MGFVRCAQIPRHVVVNQLEYPEAQQHCEQICPQKFAVYLRSVHWTKTYYTDLGASQHLEYINGESKSEIQRKEAYEKKNTLLDNILKRVNRELVSLEFNKKQKTDLPENWLMGP